MRKYMVLFVAMLGVAVVSEATVAAQAGSPSFINSSVCMSAPTLVALVLTPTGTLGKWMQHRLEPKGKS